MLDAQGRQQRIDLLRGLALVMIFVDHVEVAVDVAVLSPWTLQGWYWCDAAEVFVFLSGLVCSGSYLKTLERDGFWACQHKGLKRAGQLYLTNLACLAVILGLVVIFGPLTTFVYSRLQYQGLDRGPGPVAAASAAMLFQPLGADVLTMYIQFVALLPLVLVCWRRWPLLTKIACLEAYLAAQWFVCANLPLWPIDDSPLQACGRAFHHVAWNTLFVLGAMVALEPIRIPSRTARRVVFLICVMAVLTIAAATLPDSVGRPGILQTLREWRASAWCRKATIGPLRLGAFLALAYVTSVVVSEAWCRRYRRVLGPLMLLGRNSLPAYSAGLVLTHAVWLVASEGTWERNIRGLLMYEACGVVMMLLAGTVSERQRAPNRPLAEPVTGPDERRVLKL